MDTPTLAQDARPRPPTDPEAHAELLTAAKAALARFDRLEEHAPEGQRFGGEARVRTRLRRAIGRATGRAA